ncbi:F-box/LRR-repeat protein 7-like isoform X2 [Ptychodera flava]|uniref:F-box/LRR-repeat protein 7-like isoform X2 n=1 Tax=Ptychodera flava TaxID=63121 RepID=UPI003969C61B
MGTQNSRLQEAEAKTNSSLSQSDLSSTLEDFTPQKPLPNGTVHRTQGHELELCQKLQKQQLEDQVRTDGSMSMNSGNISSSGNVSNGNMSSTPVSSASDADIERHGTRKKTRTKVHHLSMFDMIPNGLVIKIFSYLSTTELCKCTQVCRLWYHLSWEPTLWRTIKLNSYSINVDKALRILTKRLCRETPNVCLTVQKIVLSGCEQLTDRGLFVIAKRCPELQKLELSGCAYISNEALFEVISRCPHLDYLDISGCHQITCIDLSLEASLNVCPLHGKRIQIRHLDMTDCYGLEDAGLKIIASNCTDLVNLYLRRCVRVTDLGVQFVASYCTMLRELSVSDCYRITDYALRDIARSNPRLRYLSVAKCDLVTDIGVRYIAKYCYKIRYLNVRGCEQVTDVAMEHLARNCQRLRSLDIGKCTAITDAGLIIVAANCMGLRRLSIKSCLGITDKGILALAKCCPDLQQLNIQDCNLTLEAYHAVKRQCKRCIIEHTNPAFY